MQSVLKEILWPEFKKNNYFICHSQFDLRIPIPTNTIFEILSLYLNLQVKYLDKNRIIFKEGCVTTNIEVTKTKTQLKITSRLFNPHCLSVQTSETDENFYKTTNILLYLFNEYRIITESVFIKCSIPYKVLLYS